MSENDTSIPVPSEVIEPYSSALPASKLVNDGIITLERAQEIARLNNPNYLATLHLVNAARMRYLESLGAYLPEISAGLNLKQELIRRANIVNPLETTVEHNNMFDLYTGLKSTWLLFDGFARELEVLVRRKEEKYAERSRQNVLRILDRAVAYAYYDVMLAIEMERIAASDIVFQQSSLAQAIARHRSGFIAKSDLLGFRVDLAKAKVRLIKAKEAYQLARFVLSSLLGYPGGNLPESVKVPSVPDTIPQLGAIPELLIHQALGDRPDLMMDRLLVQIGNYRKKQALSAFFPVVNAFGTLGYLGSGDKIHNDGNRFFRNYNEYSGSYGVMAEWLIFNGFRRYNLYRERKELYEKSKLDLSARQLTVMAEVESAYVVFQSNAESARYYREMQQWVFEQRNLVNVEYWAGNVTITRLRGAQTDLIAAQSSFVSSIINIYKASAQLTAATGVQTHLWEPERKQETIDRIFDNLEKKFGDR